MTAAPEDERLAVAWLSRVVEPGHAHIWRLVQRLGAIGAVDAIRSGTAPADVLSAAGARSHHDGARRDLDAAERIGARLVVPGDDEWPAEMDSVLARASANASGISAVGPKQTERDRYERCVVPSLGLWVRGPISLREALARGVAIVGSRAATAYGEHVTAEIAHGLASASWTVVSGGAYGIDHAAHRGALDAGGITVAVLASGLDRPYPRSNDATFARILGDGLLVSEHPVGSAPLRHRFLVRNRLIAAMSAGTVVTEAAARSGALATARRARLLGRHLMAVPGPATSAMSVGCHLLIREGATLVTAAGEVLDVVGRIGTDLAARPQGEMTVVDELDPLVRRVLDAVPVTKPVTVDRVASVAGVPAVETLRALALLEVRELVVATTGGFRLATDPRAGRSPNSAAR
ncbi:MAG: DNA-processing protein DprA [Mycobacteriales bacterium]